MRLFANDLEAVTMDGEYPLNRVELQKGKRAKRARTLLRRYKNRI